MPPEHIQIGEVAVRTVQRLLLLGQLKPLGLRLEQMRELMAAPDAVGNGRSDQVLAFHERLQAAARSRQRVR